MECAERDISLAEWLFGAALVIEGKDLNAASTHLRQRTHTMPPHQPS